MDSLLVAMLKVCAWKFHSYLSFLHHWYLHSYLKESTVKIKKIQRNKIITLSISKICVSQCECQNDISSYTYSIDNFFLFSNIEYLPSLTLCGSLYSTVSFFVLLSPISCAYNTWLSCVFMAFSHDESPPTFFLLLLQSVV